MFKKFINVSLIALLSLSLAACGNATTEQASKDKTGTSNVTNKNKESQSQNGEKADVQEDKDKNAAQNVMIQFEETQSKISYKDMSTFTAGDKFLTPDFAKKYHEQIRLGIEQFIKDSKGTVTGKTPKITFVEQNDNHILFNFAVERTISIEQPKKDITTYVEYLVTVSKQKDGSFLISDMVEPK